MEQIKEGNQVLIDKNLENSIKLPHTWKKKINDKYKLKDSDIEPFFHEKINLQQIEEEKLENKKETVMDVNF